MLQRLLYFSENTMHGRDMLSQLRGILSTSQRNNKAAGVTGALVFDDQWFLQALEGDRCAIWATLKRIEDDERHANVIVVDARHVDKRLFPDWSMGLARRTPENAEAFAPFLRNGLLQPHMMKAEDVIELMCSLRFKGKVALAA